MTYLCRIKWKAHVPFNVIMATHRRIPYRQVSVIQYSGRMFDVYVR